MDFASGLSAGKASDCKRFVDLGIMPGCRAPTFSGMLARVGGRFSHRPQRVNNWDFPPILLSVGSSTTRDGQGGISSTSVSWHGGGDRLCAGAWLRYNASCRGAEPQCDQKINNILGLYAT